MPGGGLKNAKAQTSCPNMKHMSIILGQSPLEAILFLEFGANDEQLFGTKFVVLEPNMGV